MPQSSIINVIATISFAFISNLTWAANKNSIEYCQQQYQKDEQLSFCLDHVKDNAERELQIWLNNQIFTLDELQKVTGRGAALKIFKRSQEMFEKFREDNCRWQYLQIAPATGAATAYKKCYIKLTKARINELTELNK